MKDWADYQAGGGTAEDFGRMLDAATPWTEYQRASDVTDGPWDRAQSAPDFINSPDDDLEYLEHRLLAPGCVTEIFSPRGIGKTQVAHALAVKLAKAGFRVLLLDRDNPRRVVKRRLRAWGGVDAQLLKVMGRNEVPPLNDLAAWATFPVQNYDLIIIDSLDSTAEGIGEKDSAKPSRALTPILDIAHGPNGPAVLVLGNTVRSGAHSRGSGVIEDRADICYEVRDATGLVPSGTKEWWLELPAGDAGSWGDRAARRKGLTVFRLAFVPSKFRIGEEPEPFIFELDLSGETWNLEDITEDVVDSGKALEAERAQDQEAQRNRIKDALVLAIKTRHQNADPMRGETEAVPFLVQQGLSRAKARTLLKDGMNRWWRVEILTHQKGRPHILVPLEAVPCQSTGAAAEIQQSETSVLTRLLSAPISAARMDTERRKSDITATAPGAEFHETTLFPPSTYGKSEDPSGEVFTDDY